MYENKKNAYFNENGLIYNKENGLPRYSKGKVYGVFKDGHLSPENADYQSKKFIAIKGAPSLPIIDLSETSTRTTLTSRAERSKAELLKRKFNEDNERYIRF